jgi:hypothetical protein
VFMYPHTHIHISREVLIFLFFFIKREKNEGDYMTKV